jgi:predicted pyridoxine 5'-phosphate oxidase superfamily flavin-nucleotide-binding protein
MPYGFLDIAITPNVKAAQVANGADALWSAEIDRQFDRFTAAEAGFIAARDSFYMASVSETGWPYVQHRGGPAGFLKVVDERTLAFADFRGNRQYISLGNLTANPRVSLILMDYANRRRLKIYGRLEAMGLEADPALTEAASLSGYRGRPERVLKITLEAFDWNCQQHITPRFTGAEIAAAIAPEQARLAELEAENRDLRARLAALGTG